MSFSELIGAVIGEVTRHSVAKMIGEDSTPPCSECGSPSTVHFHARQPCCGRILCRTCAQEAVIHGWPGRIVLRCDHCQAANAFSLSS